MDDAAQAQALAAIAQGAQHAPIVNGEPPASNGDQPAAPPGRPVTPQAQATPRADQRPADAEATLWPLEARLACLQDDLAAARKVNRVLTTTLIASLVLLLIATQAPQAIPGFERAGALPDVPA